MSPPAKQYLWHEPSEAETDAVEFRLTYAGPLHPDNSGSRDIATHKHDIRKAFHTQLRQLWRLRPQLEHKQYPLPDHAIWEGSYPTGERSAELASQFQRIGYRFVPLVTKDLGVSCDLDILWLRHGTGGRVIRKLDIDNRIKTLFDALKMPEQRQDLGTHVTPAADEDPFYCLVQDDALITSLAVSTDVLLEPINLTAPPAASDTRLIITVTVRPIKLMWENMVFG